MYFMLIYLISYLFHIKTIYLTYFDDNYFIG